jgi:hypothetical protein
MNGGANLNQLCCTFTAGDLAGMAESVRSFGFGALNNGLSPETLIALQAEADRALATMARAESSTTLKYSARMCGLGPVASAVLKGEDMSGLLERVFDGQFELSDHISCLTHYGPADHLGAHLDKPASDCVVTILLYLRARSRVSSTGETGLLLHVYGETEDTVGEARLSIPTCEGTVVLGRGSQFWHERPRLQVGEEVIAITGCYKACE